MLQNLANFRYLGTKVTNRDLINKEIKSRINLGNACYHSLQNLMSSSLLPKNVRVKIYKTTILPAVLSECVSATKRRMQTEGK
jgi:hypothetical protein